jgi:chromosome segregation ATPase
MTDEEETDDGWATVDMTPDKVVEVLQELLEDEPGADADRYRLAWQSARQRAAVLSAELTRRAPLLGEYAAENTKLHQWHDEDRTALVEMRSTIERLRAELANRSHDLNQAAKDAVRYADEVAQLRTEKQTAPADLAAVLDRAREWVNSEVVTAVNEFGNGYREAQRDIHDLLDGRRIADETQQAREGR